MKKQLVFILISSLLIVFSCKKKEASSDTSQSTTTTGPSPVTNYNGFFPLEKYCSWYNGVVSYPVNPYECKVQLYNNPVNDYTLYQAAKLGTVSINGNQLKFLAGINLYEDTVYSPYPNYSVQKNITLSSPVLPSFTFAVTDTFPVYTSANAIQINDTIKLNSNFVIPLNNLTYHDKVYCTITTNPTNTSLIIGKEVLAGVNQLVFTPADLSIFTVGQQLNCRLVLKKYSTQTFGGKNFRFECLGYNDFYMLAQ